MQTEVWDKNNTYLVFCCLQTSKHTALSLLSRCENQTTEDWSGVTVFFYPFHRVSLVLPGTLQTTLPCPGTAGAHGKQPGLRHGNPLLSACPIFCYSAGILRYFEMRMGKENGELVLCQLWFPVLLWKNFRTSSLFKYLSSLKFLVLSVTWRSKD